MLVSTVYIALGPILMLLGLEVNDIEARRQVNSFPDKKDNYNRRASQLQLPVDVKREMISE